MTPPKEVALLQLAERQGGREPACAPSGLSHSSVSQAEPLVRAKGAS
jgi:hypothetical protein